MHWVIMVPRSIRKLKTTCNTAIIYEFMIKIIKKEILHRNNSYILRAKFQFSYSPDIRFILWMTLFKLKALEN